MPHGSERPTLWCWTSGEKGLAEPVSPEAAAVAGWADWGDALAEQSPWESTPTPWNPGDNGLCSPGDAMLPPVVVAGPCTSAFDVAWRLFPQWQAPVCSSVVAVSQSSGRGQLRRAWLSPPENLHLVIHWPSYGILSGPLAFLAAGLAMAETLEQIGVSTQLKWPNDLLWEGKKVGGLLVEERGGAMVVGIGLNLGWAPGAEALREGAAVPAGCLDWKGGPLRLWLAILPRFEAVCKTLQLLDPEELCAMAERRLAWLHQTVGLRQVQVRDGADFDNSEGTIVGGGVDGSLQVQVRGCVHHVVAAQLHPDMMK